MSIRCKVILQDTVSREQLAALGTALWRWCIPAAGNTGIYQFHDYQALADLIAGNYPRTSRLDGHLWLRDEVSPNLQATIESLRREIPAQGIEDIFVEGNSWNAIVPRGHAQAL